MSNYQKNHLYLSPLKISALYSKAEFLRGIVNKQDVNPTGQKNKSTALSTTRKKYQYYFYLYIIQIIVIAKSYKKESQNKIKFFFFVRFCCNSQKAKTKLNSFVNCLL